MAGAADAALHLVDDQQCAGGVAGRPSSGEVARRRRNDPTLAQGRLEQHRSGMRTDCTAQCVDVAVVDEGDGSGQWRERLAFRGIARDGKGAHRSAVEAVIRGDDLESPAGWIERAAVASCKFQRALDSLGTAVGEEHAAVGAEQLQQALGQPHAWFVDGEVGRVHEPRHLRRHGLDDGRMGMPERGGRDSADEIEVFAAVDVPHAHARAMVDGQGRCAVVGHHRGGPSLL